MIAVIADDFTGAAELAGISLRYGLQVKLYTGIAMYEHCDVCVVSTDSRSMNKTDALTTTCKIIEALQAHQPSFIYKKIDSVLRGYVIDELKLQMKLTGKPRAVIIPANPSLGRKIINGHYYINDQLITQTQFFNDPEFPVRSSDIRSMIGDDHGEVAIVRTNDGNSAPIVLVETASLNEIDHWSREWDRDCLAAGAGDFFESILAASFPQKQPQSATAEFPYLFVCGTLADASIDFVDEVNKESGLVMFLGHKHMSEGALSFSFDEKNKIRDIVSEKMRLLLAIEDDGSLSARQVRERMADAVKQLLSENDFSEIFIEGGSTAASILDRLGLNSFEVVNEMRRGVVRMKVDEFYITVKPGSYAIPDTVRQIFLTKAT